MIAIDQREDLKNQLCMMLMSKGINIESIMNDIYIILDKYEITSRTTEIAILKEDRNKELLARFLVAKTVSGRTEKTIKFYRQSIEHMLDRIGKTIDDVKADDIRLYLAKREKIDGVTKTTAGNELRCFRSFCGWLQTEEILVKNACAKVDSVRPPKIKKKAFTEIDIAKIRSAVKNNREKALVEILISTGARVTEVSNIKINDIEEDSLIVTGKGNKDRTVYLTASAQVAISEYLAERSDTNPYVFPGAKYKVADGVGYRYSKSGKADMGMWYKDPALVSSDLPQDTSSIESIIRKIGKRAGVENCHPHRFRRSCATMALRRGMPIEQVSKMLGHEQLDTTKIYLDLSEDDLKSAHQKYVL